MKNQKSKHPKSKGKILPPLPAGVTAEDVGRALVRQIKPVEKVATRESDKPPKHLESENE